MGEIVLFRTPAELFYWRRFYLGNRKMPTRFNQEHLEIVKQGEKAIDTFSASQHDQLPFQLEGADLRKVPLQGCNLSRAYLMGAQFQGNKTLNGTNFNKADLTGAHFDGASNIPLLPDENLKQLGFEGATLKDATFDGVAFRRAHFENCRDAVNASFVGSSLKHSMFRRCNLKGADFTDATLHHSEFSKPY